MATRVNIFATLIICSLFFAAVGIFTSITISSGSHIFILLALFYWWFFLEEDKGISTFKLSELSYCSLSMLSLLALLIFAVFSIFINWHLISNVHSPFQNIFQLKYLIIGLLAVFVFRRAFFSKTVSSKILKNGEWLFLLFLLATTLATVSGFSAQYTGYHHLRMKLACHPERNCGMYGMYMTYGYGIQFFMIILTAFIIDRKKIFASIQGHQGHQSHQGHQGHQSHGMRIMSKVLFSPLFLWLIWIINFLGLIYSQARGALVGFAMAIPFFLIAHAGNLKLKIKIKIKKSPTTFLLLATLILSLLMLTTYLLRGNIRELFFSYDRLNSNSIRVAQMQAVWEVVKVRPVLGLGFRNFEPYSAEIKRRAGIDHEDFTGHAHNNFLEHFASSGFLGLIALIAFHFFWAQEAYLRRMHPLGKISLPLVVALTVSGLFQYTFGDGENMFLIMLIYSLFQVTVRQESAP